MRLFVAWSLPATLRSEISSVVAPRRSQLHGSWVRSDAFHLTLAFLGEHPPEVVSTLRECLERNLSECQPFDASLGRAGFFPSRSAPRVGWIGLEPEKPLNHLAEKVRSALVEAQVLFDAKPFHPHLTLVRIRRRWNIEERELFLHNFEHFRSSPVPVDRVTLFESHLKPGGAVHEERISVMLKRP